MNKLLCIVGPTGTGKTARAIELSKKQPSILVSADSRQVYRGMDIVTGKDHPKGITIYGTDILDPDEPCSVSAWYNAVISHINNAWQEEKQVIVVGGTGLYVKALTGEIETMQIPINQILRDQLNPLSIAELQSKLKDLALIKFNSMNHSDLNNPRRLIRAIEVASSPHDHLESSISDLESKIIGLRYFDDSNYRSKVYERVLNRIKLGAIEETQQLLAKYNQNLQSMSAIGYKSIIQFIRGLCTREQMINQWASDELAYAKRQMTWFRKQPVIWYDVTYGNKKN